MTITKRFEWDMGHRVTDHASKCRNLHGHRYAAEFTVSGPIKHQPGMSDYGMVMDFGDIKARLASLIDGLDHSMMLWTDDPLHALFKAHPLLCEHKLVSLGTVPTAENIAEWLLIVGQTFMPEGVTLARVKLYETPTSSAEAAWRM